MQVSMELSKALNKCSQGVIPYVLALSELFKLNHSGVGGGEMAQRAKALATQACYLSSSPVNLKTEGASTERFSELQTGAVT